MRLLKVKLEGVRRFEESDALLVADRLVAIVGPNEAGKTSLLRALEEIDRIDDPFPAMMGTRQCSVQPSIRALFELDEGDRAALSSIHDTGELRRFWLVRTTTGTRWGLERSPRRDLAPRRSLEAALASLSEDEAVQLSLEDNEHPLDGADWEAVRALSQAQDDSLTDDRRSTVERLAEALEAVEEVTDDEAGELDGDEDGRAAAVKEWEEARLGVARLLRDVAAAEARPGPWQLAVEVLRDRLPTIIEFGDEDRDLRTEYDLQEIGDDDPPAALANVAALAELGLVALRQAIESGDHGTVRLLREGANTRLAAVFNESYAQSDVCLQFDTSGSVIRLLVRSEGGEDFVELSERSAGFRWFVALVAFLARRHYERPLVLIDEIETHLHYAAQADVVDVLSRQTIAEQVIYTTHSAGALPPDLGRGVRAVVPIEGRQRSEIKNSFWTSGPGFTPLLFGLGASTLPFSIPRYLIVAEGASDAILLPSLIREATGLEDLPYRVAPGLANTPPGEFHRLDTEGGRVTYLVDGDDAGCTYSENLRAAGVDSGRILDFAQFATADITPEDCVELDVLVDAVNREGEPFWNGLVLAADDLPVHGRARAIEEWCSKNGIPMPSKVRIAQAIIEQTWAPLTDDEGPEMDGDTEPGASVAGLCSADGARWLRTLHEAALASMGLDAAVSDA